MNESDWARSLDNDATTVESKKNIPVLEERRKVVHPDHSDIYKQIKELQNNIYNLSESVQVFFTESNQRYDKLIELMPVVRRHERLIRSELYEDIQKGERAEMYLEQMNT